MGVQHSCPDLLLACIIMLLTLLTLFQQLNVMCTKKLASPKYYSNSVHKYFHTTLYHVVIMHTPSTLDPGNYMYIVYSTYSAD